LGRLGRTVGVAETWFVISSANDCMRADGRKIRERAVGSKLAPMAPKLQNITPTISVHRMETCSLCNLILLDHTPCQKITLQLLHYKISLSIQILQILHECVIR